MVIERVCKELGVIEKMFLTNALRLITKESHWSSYAAKDRLQTGMTLETPVAKYVKLSS